MRANIRSVAFALACCAAMSAGVAAHEGVVVGHSPEDPEGVPPCPTLEPLKLFLLPDARLGGPIDEGAYLPIPQGDANAMTRMVTNALLARPEFGGFVYVKDTPDMAYVDAANPCHAMTTAFTGGQPFTVGLMRSHWPDGINFMLADPFGAMVLMENGAAWTYGDQNGGHVHPLWLSRRAGRYFIGSRVTSSFFAPSDDFSLTFATTPECAAAVAFDMSGIFNADVIDSDAVDAPTSFDGAGRSWVLNGLYGTDRGIPINGALDVFQLGGPNAGFLTGSALNCLFDDGSSSTLATLILSAAGQNDFYQSVELLIGASGAFTNADSLVVRMNYSSGSQQVVTVRRAASSPRFFPINDWLITGQPLPHLSVGPSGTRDGGGFVRSTGSGIDNETSPPESFYFQRVTFPVDATRELLSIAFDNYSGVGRIGVFAATGMREVPCLDGDVDADGDVDLDDAQALVHVLIDVPLRALHVYRSDINHDGSADALDIAHFLTAMLGM